MALIASMAVFDCKPLHIRFNQQVNEARWDEAQQQWVLTLNGQQQVRHNLVVFAVGQLNRPMIPEITGRETFKGPNFHSANWDHSIDWKNKRVAVIGTGTSAVQFIQQLANVAEHVGIFARTPNWLLPSPDRHDWWQDDARAYIGTSTPGFPNLFCMYDPRP